MFAPIAEAGFSRLLKRLILAGRPVGVLNVDGG